MLDRRFCLAHLLPNVLKCYLHTVLTNKTVLVKVLPSNFICHPLGIHPQTQSLIVDSLEHSEQ